MGPVEQKHVDKVVKAFGGPKLKAGYRQFSSKTLEIEEIYIYIYTCACGEPMRQVSETSRKSVTVSWGKNGGLKESLGSQKIGFYILKAQHFFGL